MLALPTHPPTIVPVAQDPLCSRSEEKVFEEPPWLTVKQS